MNDKKAAAKLVASASEYNRVFSFGATDTKLLSATNSAALIQKIPFKSAKCSDCGTHMVSNLKSPFCMTCGSEHVEVSSEQEETINVPKDEKCSGIVCSSCNQVNVFESSVVTASKTALHCTRCGESLTAADAEPDLIKLDGTQGSQKLAVDKKQEDEVKAGNVISHKMQSNELVNVPAEAGQPPLNVTIPSGAEEAPGNIADMISDPTLDALDEIDADLELAEAGDDIPFEGDGTSISDSGTSAPLMAEDGDDLEMLDDGEEEQAEADDEMPYVDSEPVYAEGEPFVDVMGVDNTVEDLNFVATANKRLAAMKGSLAIAYLPSSKAVVSEAALFNKDFAEAARRVVASRGLRQGLASLGFSFVKVPTLSEASVASKIKAAETAVAKKLEADRAAFEESISIAAAGLARDQWKAVKNPLTVAVAAALSNAGVSNAQRVAKNVVTRASTEYVQALLSMTDSLVKVGSPVRASFKAAFDMTTASADDFELNVDEPQLGESETQDELLDDMISRFMRSSSKQPMKASALTAVDSMRTRGFGFSNQ